MNKNYDVIIVGGGVAGTTLASGLKNKGKSVLVIESKLWGGTCPNVGCDPKKILLSAAEIKQASNNLQGFGLKGIPSIKWADLMKNKRTYTDTVSEGTLASLKAQAIDTIKGHPTFLSDGSLQVDSSIYTGTDYVIATGQRPIILPIEGKEIFKTSDDFLNLSQLPKRIAFVGGGFIGFELAAIAATAGSKVRVINNSDQPLNRFDHEYVQKLMSALTKQGVEFDLNVNITRLLSESDGIHLLGEADYEQVSDYVVCSVGRRSNDDHLGLEEVGVQYGAHGIKVNDHLQTDNPHIYAIGDVNDRPVPKITPLAWLEGHYLVDELTESKSAIKYPAIPNVVYAAPKLAQVGVNTATAADDPSHYQIKSFDLTKWFTYYRLHTPLSLAKVVIDKENGLIVGATVLSDIADEMINYLTFVIQKKISLKELQQLVLAYPTAASDLQFLF